MADPRNFSPIQAFFYRVIVLTSQDAIFVPGQRSKLKGHIKLRIEENLVAVLVSDLWAMAGKNGTVFATIDRHLECAIQTELVVELELALIERKQYRRFRYNSIIC